MWRVEEIGKEQTEIKILKRKEMFEENISRWYGNKISGEDMAKSIRYYGEMKQDV